MDADTKGERGAFVAVDRIAGKTSETQDETGKDKPQRNIEENEEHRGNA